MFAMVTAWVVALGGSTALDTLCSQAWTGSDNPHVIGILLQRAYILLGLMFIPIGILWWNVEPLLIYLGQAEELSRMAATFLRYLLVGAPGYILFEATKKYLQAQGIMHVGTYILLLASPLSAALSYSLVWSENFGMGFVGAPIAISITYWAMFGMIIFYIWKIDGSAGWGGFSRLAFHNLGGFMKLAISGILMVGTEWWAFEIVALAAGRISRVSLAAQSVIMTTDQVLNTIPFGISVASSNRIGNLLGEGKARAARNSANLSAMMAATIGTAVMALMIIFRKHFGYLFSDEEDVVMLVSEVMPWVAAFQIADGVAGSCGGSLRGMGNQHLGATVNLVSYYVLALPLGIYLAFKCHYGLTGLWVGQCVALFLVGSFEWGIVALSDYEQEVNKCSERLRNADINAQ
jgi:MATE family multidrug resistance protein